MPKSILPPDIKLRRHITLEYIEYRYDTTEFVVYQRAPGWAELNKNLQALCVDQGIEIYLHHALKQVLIILIPNING